MSEVYWKAMRGHVQRALNGMFAQVHGCGLVASPDGMVSDKACPSCQRLMGENAERIMADLLSCKVVQ